ncbi:DEDD2 protein, partial [Eulacestoma nigropectus]|nr:DEDD2 protein [Eulacestoma nigropectus]
GAGPPRNGLELLLEMERRGLCHEGDFGHLRQLLRLVTRHDLLRCVTLKRPRPGTGSTGRTGRAGSVGGSLGALGRSVQCRNWVYWENWADWTCRGNSGACEGSESLGAAGTGHTGSTGNAGPVQPVPGLLGKLGPYIRLRVRAEYCEHERALRRGVASSRPRGPGRQLDVFGQASGVLKSRDLGSILCDIKFSELSYLEAFWGDYLSGALLEALKGVFLTEGLRRAVGREDVRLLVSVDQDDYEAGRRLLLQAQGRGGR